MTTHEKLRRVQAPPAKTVGELIGMLQHMPKDMPILSGCDDAVEVCVVEVNRGYLACSIEPSDLEE